MRVRTIAPAKINWTLEALGRRPDGYHEVRTIMQTIDLCDEVEVASADSLSLEVAGAHSATDDDHTLLAARLLGRAVGRELPVGVRVAKRIPVSAGLGGGSSDAAAVLRGIRSLSGCDVPDTELAVVASEIGSDAPFFLRGGTALASGRGEVIEPLPDAPEAWLVVVAPPISMPEKTKTMYAALGSEDFSDGRRTEALADRLRRAEGVREEDMCNTFERAAYESLAGLAVYRDRLLSAGAAGVHVAGAGPALFAVFGSRTEAEHVSGALAGSDGRVFVARTLGTVEATRFLD